MGSAAISGERPWRRTRRAYVGSVPAAGSDWSVIVPAGVVWELVSIVASLTTSATAGNRGGNLTVTIANVQVALIPPASVQAASLTRGYCWFESGNGYNAGSKYAMPLPRYRLPAGSIVASSTDTIDVADQWTAPVLYVVETMTRGGDISVDELPELLVEVMALPAA